MSSNPTEAGLGASEMERIRVVIVEDHALVREGTRQILQRHRDIEVIGEASDGEEAIDLIRRLRPDIAIVDIALPRKNGIDVTREIRGSGLPTRILILSAYDDDEYIFALLEAGAAGYVLKNVRAKELADAVRLVQDGEAVFHPAITKKVLARLAGSQPARPAPAQPTEAVVTERERQVLMLAARGLSNKAIARELKLSVRTVQAHLNHIFNRLGVSSRTEAAVFGLSHGWFRLEDIS